MIFFLIFSFSFKDDDKNKNTTNSTTTNNSTDYGDIQPFADEVIEADELEDSVNSGGDSERSPRLRHREATSRSAKSDYKPKRASNSMVLEEMDDFDDDFGDDFI